MNKLRETKPRSFVIAEAGSNHNNDLEIGKMMIDKAVNAGCSAVKFQLFRSDTLYNKHTPNFASYDNIPKLMKNLELSYEHAVEYMQYCDQLDIEFMATPFDEETLKWLVDGGIKRIKIAGFEASDPRFVRMCAETKLPLIISIGSGMSLEDAINLEDDLFWEWGVESEVTFLHCNNAYPTPLEDSCLATIDQYKRHLGRVKLGFSDHTQELITPALAVMVGATVIEKHFTLSNQMKGPDHKFAVEANDLPYMIKAIKQAETTLSVKPLNGTKSEKDFGNARRSVVAKTDLPANTILSEENITTSRPFLSNTIPASRYYELIGRKIRKSYKAGEMLIVGDV